MTRRPLLTLALLATLAAPAAAQSAAAPQGRGGMGMDHAAMMRMDSLDARLDSLLGLMRGARGDKKVNAMAALLGELVDQHLAMRREMHERMMNAEAGGGGMRHEGMGMGGQAGGMGHEGMAMGGQGGGMRHEGMGMGGQGGGMRHEGGMMGGGGGGPSEGKGMQMSCPMMSPDSTAPAAGGQGQHH